MTLPDGNQWHVRIDKLACDDKGNYYVMDYKTNSRMKDQEEADSDRQLALYSIWVKDKFKDAKSVKLVWHMLAFNKEAVSERTDAQLKVLQKEVTDKIKEIENAKEFPRNETALCNYCVYKEICPSFKHEQELEGKGVKEFKENEGVKLVDEFSEIKNQLHELTKRQVELGGSLIDFSKQFGVDKVYGSNMKASVKDIKKIVIPEEKKEKIIEMIKKKGLWDDFAMLNYMKFNSRGRKGELDKDIMKQIEIDESWRVSLSKRRDIEGEDK